ncbi:Phosphatidylserine synthase [Candidatus Phytoplasma australiense]|uniref:Phosphatidylserine synthase n=2 Tax=Phytoplasma australiense TaxID=59748 RepID=B1VAI7_PHYAS|nr:CDP-alcohol phosphatidyltransferase family protein [Candidatus Phytoplasma australiense]AGL90356.1 CDP-diacylglycerol--serine O-phosphatidyltransferase [Strawberry lethal yellows phytoplasma (CPA) str. NZSb11]CAM11960.1 Phosphatidylserine synthase [Candidatus Phytoplasma australiense]
MFLGLYNYTTYLTYLNLLSGFFGIIFAVQGQYIPALIFLLLSGICDMFDGLVSKTKKNRTLFDKRYGVQIDSLADIISFGVLPIFINYSLAFKNNKQEYPFHEYFIWPVWGLYLLAVLIRLAYYNTLSENDINKGSKKFIGFPVTTSAIVFPLLGFFTKLNDSYPWFKIHLGSIMILTFLFLCDKIIIRKPKYKKTIIIFGLFGLVEIFILFGVHILRTRS